MFSASCCEEDGGVFSASACEEGGGVFSALTCEESGGVFSWTSGEGKPLSKLFTLLVDVRDSREMSAGVSE